VQTAGARRILPKSALCQLLDGSPCLESLDLSWNPGLYDDALLAALACNGPSLTHLDLAGCNLISVGGQVGAIWWLVCWAGINGRAMENRVYSSEQPGGGKWEEVQGGTERHRGVQRERHRMCGAAIVAGE
jgi:Leucine Rich repeat